MSRIYNVLFLCTGNSARSIMAEAICNNIGKGRFRAFSAGRLPQGHVYPLALAVIERSGLTADDLHSKSWSEFFKIDAPVMDFVFTLCDKTAGDHCPVWPGRPINGHWSFDDPAAVQGTPDAQLRAFERSFHEISNRIRIFLSLPIEKLDRIALSQQIDQMGST
jgi:arsenate reductase